MGRHGENIRKRKDGRWEARYLFYNTENGCKSYRSVYGHSYEEAKAKRAMAWVSPATCPKTGKTWTAQTNPSTVLSFDTAANEWLASVKSKQKPSTYEKYRLIYQTFLKQTLGDISIQTMTEQLVSRRLDSCVVSSDSLWKSIYCVLNGILRYMSEQYHLFVAPMKKTFSTTRRPEALTFTNAEQAKLLSILYTDTNRFKLGTLLCLFTGLRLGELCALKWEDIDFAGKTLSVNRTVQRLYVENGASRTKLVETSPKSGHSRREIPLQDEILAFLMNFRSEKEYVFGDDAPLDPRTMQNHYKKILKEAGVRYQNFHTLRHTYATNCIEGGADVKSLSEMLGHSNVKITLNYYVHPSMDTKRRYADKLCAFYVMLHGQIMGSAGQKKMEDTEDDPIFHRPAQSAKP